MGDPVRRRCHQAALSIWLVCAVWLSLIVSAVAAGDHAYRDRPLNSLGFHEGLGEFLFVHLCWVVLFGWLGYEVWHGRKVLAIVGIFVPITLIYSVIGLALSLGGSGDVDHASLPSSLALLVGGVVTTVFLIRAAIARPS